ncbi:MAG: hypothetical protein PWP09_1556, partial [Thermotogota bacterium]|nr:hypothetical protein [Thermotogota bacterium]
ITEPHGCGEQKAETGRRIFLGVIVCKREGG